MHLPKLIFFKWSITTRFVVKGHILKLPLCRSQGQ